MKPIAGPIRYAGTKLRLMRKLVDLLPQHHAYVSLCGGSGSDILAKKPSRLEVYNDVDSDLYNLFAVLRSADAAELIRLVGLTPHSRRLFGESKERLRDPNLSRVERAWVTLILANQGWLGPHFSHDANAWCYYVRPQPPHRWYSLGETLRRVVERFSRVQLECDNWDAVLNRYDLETTLFYIDPPYLHCTRRGPRNEYRHDFSLEDHVRLLDRVKKCRGGVMLSGYPSDLYDRELREWTRIEIPTTFYASRAATRTARTEVVWTNCCARNKGVSR
jgi:DNA adenine methylase